MASGAALGTFMAQLDNLHMSFSISKVQFKQGITQVLKIQIRNMYDVRKDTIYRRPL